MRKLIVLVVVLAVIVGAPLSAAAWSGVVQVPVVSGVFGMDRARDLGMQQDRQAFEDFATQFGIERPSAPANYTLASPHHWSGAVQVDGVITEAALGSLREFNSENPYLSGINFRIHPGYVEMAAFVKGIPGYPFSGPVYGKFSIQRNGPKSVSVNISSLQFGNIGVPGNYIDQAKTEIGTYLNTSIVKAGISIDSLELREGGIYFKGTWPKTVTADPPASGQVP
jgi:hypothetical protein